MKLSGTVHVTLLFPPPICGIGAAELTAVKGASMNVTGPCRAGRSPAVFTSATTAAGVTDQLRVRKLSGLARSSPELTMITGASMKIILVRTTVVPSPGDEITTTMTAAWMPGIFASIATMTAAGMARAGSTATGKQIT
jgi:hypothetical protein